MFVFFLRYSLTRHENPLEIFPYGEATGHDKIPALAVKEFAEILCQPFSCLANFLDNHKVISLVSMDLSKVFDTLPHDRIVKNLEITVETQKLSISLRIFRPM